jgi:glutathione S-transferase
VKPVTITLHELALSGDIRPSPYCWRAKYALEHKGLEYNISASSFSGIAGIAGGGQKTVPVLEITDTADPRVVGDSWEIANFLEETYPDKPSLFGGEQGRSFAFFFQNWSLLTLHLPLMKAILLDIVDRVLPEEKEQFRQVREQRVGMTLEEIASGTVEQRVGAVRAALEPARAVLRTQPFLSGAAPRYADYILAGQLHWPREASPLRILESDDPVMSWFERMLELYPRIVSEGTRTWDGP